MFKYKYTKQNISKNILKITFLCLVNISLFLLCGCGKEYYLKKMEEARKKNDKSWLKYLEKAADAGDLHSQKEISFYYRVGMDLPEDHKKSFYWAKRAANNDESSNLEKVLLAQYYLEGIGVKKDSAKAISIYSKLADAGGEISQRQLIQIFYSGRVVKKDYIKAYKFAEKYAAQNNHYAQLMQAKMLIHGKGVKKNIPVAMNVYQKSADEGSYLCQNQLIKIYYHGINGVKKDLKKAFRLAEKYAKQRNLFAINKLGYMYLYGQGVKKDAIKAISYYEKGAEIEYKRNFVINLRLPKRNQNNLIGIYFYGRGVKRNYKKAYELAKKYAGKNNSTAQFILSIMYKYGKGVKPNQKNAEEWLSRAATSLNGCIPAMNELAYHYAKKNIKLKEAKSLIDRALKYKPNDPAYIDTLGWVLYKQKKYNDARIQLEKAAKIKPDSVLLDHLGDVYIKLGKTKPALEQWQKALKLSPKADLKKSIEKKIKKQACL